MNDDQVSRILLMRDRDQGARFSARGKRNTAENHAVRLVDANNNREIRRLVERFGYPTQSTVGGDAMRAFWLLIQHQDEDPELQRDCLEGCDFRDDQRALLTDRVLMNFGKKQVYGTQFRRDEDGVLRLWPVEDLERVDDRRSSVGLPPLSHDIERADRVEQEIWGRRVGGVGSD